MAKDALAHAELLRTTTAASLSRTLRSVSEDSESGGRKKTEASSSVEADDVTNYHKRKHQHDSFVQGPRPLPMPNEIPALEEIIQKHEAMLTRLNRPLTWDEKQIKEKLNILKQKFTVVPEVRTGFENKIIPHVRDRNAHRPHQTWALHGVEVVDTIPKDAQIDVTGPTRKESSESRLVLRAP